MFNCISAHPSNRYKYVILNYDYYRTKSYVCGTCGKTAQKCDLIYWPPKMCMEGGKRYPDHLSISIPFDDKCGLIVSEKTLSAFQKDNISGYKAMPIEFYDIKADSITSEEIPRYYYLVVNGSISLDYEAMHYRKKNICPDCGSFNWSRVRIGESRLDYSSWNQCDICKLVDYPNIFLCTQKVIDVIQANNLKGFTKRAETEIFMPLKAVKIC